MTNGEFFNYFDYAVKTLAGLINSASKQDFEIPIEKALNKKPKYVGEDYHIQYKIKKTSASAKLTITNSAIGSKVAADSVLSNRLKNLCDDMPNVYVSEELKSGGNGYRITYELSGVDTSDSSSWEAVGKFHCAIRDRYMKFMKEF